MLLPTTLFLTFGLWTLFHWQELPKLLRDETSDERWPLSIHYTATPVRLITVTSLYAVMSFLLLKSTAWSLSHFTPSNLVHWFSVALLIGLHFAPYSSKLSSHTRYFFQRHLFFPSLPSHQEDAIISTLMQQANTHESLSNEVLHLQTLIKQQFKTTLHAFNLVSLKNERKLVKREFKKIRHRQLLNNTELTDAESQLLRFHLYSCYRLLTRVTLARYWSGRDRRKAFRHLGYNINIGDSNIYSKCRRLKFSISNYLLHR
jgi:hypothetical protein